jgi:hypothetical protein
VATNSITQGEQVSQLWPTLFERYGLEISFAHRTFEWLSDARGRAHVHCVIVGLVKHADEPVMKRLFSYDDIVGDPVESRHAALSPYLFDATGLSNRHLVVGRSRDPGSGMPLIRVGSKPVDGGYFIMDSAERAVILQVAPNAASLIRPYVGSNELINGGDRWLLTPHGVSPAQLRAMPAVMALVDKVRRYRSGELPPRNDSEGENNKPSALSLMLAKTPTEFHVTVLPEAPFLAIPEVSSSRREYLPIAWLEPPIVPSNKLLVALDVKLHQFALITSKMHMAWTAFVGGRLKSDYQYSPGINYNPFPWPPLTDAHRARLDTHAQHILDARINHPDSTLADLYDPDSMPADLRKAHTALDAAVDRLYRKEPFQSDRERVEHLFKLYEDLTAPILAIASPSKKPRQKALKKQSG